MLPICVHAPCWIALALAYRALPAAVLPPTIAKPVTPRAFFACCTAFVHPWMFLYAFLPAADCFLVTILPDLLLMSIALVRPVLVFSLLAFIAFAAFMAFIGAAFIAFIAFAICTESE